MRIASARVPRYLQRNGGESGTSSASIKSLRLHEWRPEANRGWVTSKPSVINRGSSGGCSDCECSDPNKVQKTEKCIKCMATVVRQTAVAA